MSEKPEVDPHLGDAPADLIVEDVTEGDGAEAAAGSHVSVHYVGVAHSTGDSPSAPVGSSPAGTRACRG
jgi:peptidylprolyl isomerase